MTSTLTGKNIIITAGPTQEPIDPVRYIGNRSSGKMGFALAHAFASNGANVTLVCGPTSIQPPKDITRVDVTSAQSMFEVTQRLSGSADVIIFAAAVADYTPKDPKDQKIKKSGDTLTLELVKTVDIAETLGKQKRSNQIYIGFALETQNGLENAQSKLDRKNFDFIVLNSMDKSNQPFGSDHNKITIVDHNKVTKYEFKSKNEVAQDIVKHAIEKLVG